VPRAESQRSLPPAQPFGSFLRSSTLFALNWILLGYAIVAVLFGVAYTAGIIRADFQQTLETERGRLRGVTSALQSEAAAMVFDGVGAAVAAANETRAYGGFAHGPSASLEELLRRQLTGGEYVRALFLASRNRFLLTGRNQLIDSAHLPAWATLPAASAEGAAWVGLPFADPERPGRLVVPIAQRVRIENDSEVWAGALFSFEAFDRLFGQFSDLVRAIGLVADDGTILTSAPKLAGHDELAGRRLPRTGLMRRLFAGYSGITESYSELFGTDVIAAYERVGRYPIFAAAAQSRDAALAPWRQRRRNDIVQAVGFSLLVMVLTASLSHSMRALRRRERDYRTLFNNARFSAFVLKDDRFIEANRTAATMFGLDVVQSAIGLAPWELSPELQPDGRRSRDAARERIATALREGGTTFEWQHKRADSGETFPAEVDLSTLGADAPTLALAVVHDVTARKRAEEELHLLSAELIRLQDEERRRIGRDLHDATGGALAALELGLAQLQQSSDSLSTADRARLEQCTELARACSAEIRTASYLLHPPLLDELGLSSALRWLVDGFQLRTGIDVQLEQPLEMVRLPPADELALFRVAQEALTNVYRHSGSHRATVRVELQPGSIVLEIEDDGCGIVPLSPTSPAGIPVIGVGLAGMRERIRQMGGTLTVESKQTGTRVRAVAPTRGSAGRAHALAAEEA